MSSMTMSTTRPDRLTACSCASAGSRTWTKARPCGPDRADPVARGSRARRGFGALDQGPPLRPEQAEPGMRLGHRRQPGRRSQVLGGDALVVGAQEAKDVAPAAPVAYPP